MIFNHNKYYKNINIRDLENYNKSRAILILLLLKHNINITVQSKF
jgi:hypothetical protein